MGYTTDFIGTGFKLSRPATEVEFNYINKFSGSRRMRRDVNELMKLYKGEDGLPNFDNKPNRTPEEIYGVEGSFFVGGLGSFGQDNDSSVLDCNEPPGAMSYSSDVDFKTRWDENQKRIADGLSQPGLWCQWILEDNETLNWDGGEKFYNYVEWLEYLIKNFFEPWGIKLNGKLKWQGEDNSDMGKIEVIDNIINVYTVQINYVLTN